MDFLPENFKIKMKELLGDELDSFLDCYNEKHNAGIRVNTLKLSPERFADISPVEVSKVPWIKNGFYYDESDRASKHPYYYAGLYYIQEPSAMTPASLLPVQAGDRVLDLCAAPGGKTTELGAKLKGRGVLVCNDISNSRAKALLKNVELFGIRNAVVISEAPAKLEDSFCGYFDKILVDAPCSGEGMFRKSHAIIKNWEQYGTGYYAKLQRQILPSAVKMLKAGGYMIYSTCTFSAEEDEGTLKWLLEEYPDMEVLETADITAPGFEGFVHARPELVGGPAEIAGALRLYPHRIKGEGHFVALLRKKAGGDTAGEDLRAPKAQGTVQNAEETAGREAAYRPNRYDERTRKTYKGISAETFDFLEKLGFEIPAERLEVREDRLYMLPEGLPALKGLRIMRSGLLLGEMKKGRFEPSQALACALSADEYDNILDLPSDGTDVIRYLKCESIEIPGDTPDGYVLICTDGFPLGWGKAAQGRFRNKYLPGWRMQ
ncbi:MAG: RsmB/NOP family class I SAM-dependent RNA methyltransferase [Lachnospiraceae bacterium]|nr:RsmB/NOP family class I SAM-dependent RNA methyltransferase [Lachnospiraceae bacterium]